MDSVFFVGGLPYIYIYIYIYLLIKNLPAFTVPEKKTYQEPGEKKKLSVKKKENTNLVWPLEKNQGILSQLVKRKLKTFRKSCNATITKVLNTSGANYKINLNREISNSRLKLILYIYIYILSSTDRLFHCIKTLQCG